MHRSSNDQETLSSHGTHQAEDISKVEALKAPASIHAPNYNDDPENPMVAFFFPTIFSTALTEIL